MIRLALPLTILLLQQTENPVPCGREDDQGEESETEETEKAVAHGR